ncbi:hypothetical protein EPUS_08339 [Endocarpon pusillum Z07020]|uniref:Uncharacterized protein n=1 Tax=Endocarpon pusillum (strain Z07020 / HMAS-L-300199) TaxID=1263415 RepID=U1GG84_ENDPU|nr:uncharacterized protein EPUS_08339 [Endocarpon pusillum Z07020]ERF70781.1 hypothetical protein EPUS_08339 [Endocarpon pusillum Z07020]
MAESTDHPLAGCWQPTRLQALYYGSGSVRKHLLWCLPSPESKAFIITGSSLAQRTPLVKQVEDIPGKDHHAGTFANIKQHAPVAQLDEATEAVTKDSAVNTLISVGGEVPLTQPRPFPTASMKSPTCFSPTSLSQPTLSAAECTVGAGYTRDDGTKIGVADPGLAPHVIIYDAQFGMHTPQKLGLSTGIRAVDHAVEMLYHPTATEVPAKQLVLTALGNYSSVIRVSTEKQERFQERALHHRIAAGGLQLAVSTGHERSEWTRSQSHCWLCARLAVIMAYPTASPAASRLRVW